MASYVEVLDPEIMARLICFVETNESIDQSYREALSLIDRVNILESCGHIDREINDDTSVGMNEDVEIIDIDRELEKIVNLVTKNSLLHSGKHTDFELSQSVVEAVLSNEYDHGWHAEGLFAFDSAQAERRDLLLEINNLLSGMDVELRTAETSMSDFDIGDCLK